MGAVAILVCKSKNDLGRVTELLRGVEQGIVKCGREGNKETVTASHCLAFKSQQQQHLIGQLDNSISEVLTA